VRQLEMALNRLSSKPTLPLTPTQDLTAVVPPYPRARPNDQVRRPPNLVPDPENPDPNSDPHLGRLCTVLARDSKSLEKGPGRTAVWRDA
jgi:hypothetical protein